MEDKVLLSVEDAAHRTSLGLTVLRELINRGEIASVKVGRRRLIPARALEDFAEAKLEEAAAVG
jgi:excisionase family DNA binding protein